MRNLNLGSKKCFFLHKNRVFVHFLAGIWSFLYILTSKTTVFNLILFIFTTQPHALELIFIFNLRNKFQQAK